MTAPITTPFPPPFAPTKLFLVTPLPLVRVGLRRYQGLAGGWRCGPNKRHEATVWLEEPEEQALGDHRRTFEPALKTSSPPQLHPHHGRWPERCERGDTCTNEAFDTPVRFPVSKAYAFTHGDHAVILHERLGRREDTGEQVLAYAPPVGGVVHLDYLLPARLGADGRCVGVGTPDGLWYVDVRGRGGERFERTGAGADLTVVQTSGPPWPWRITDGVLHQEAGDAR